MKRGTHLPCLCLPCRADQNRRSSDGEMGVQANQTTIWKQIVPLRDNGEINGFQNSKSIEVRLSSASAGVTIERGSLVCWGQSAVNGVKRSLARVPVRSSITNGFFFESDSRIAYTPVVLAQ